MVLKKEIGVVHFYGGIVSVLWGTMLFSLHDGGRSTCFWRDVVRFLVLCFWVESCGWKGGDLAR
jgi:hypothetical protein